MIEVARAILETRGRDKEMYFNDLVNEIQNYLEKSDADIRSALPFFYSDLNTDGSFIPLGDKIPLRLSHHLRYRRHIQDYQNQV